MGRIYDDIAENLNEENLKTMVNNLKEICEVYEPNGEVKFRENEVERIIGIVGKSSYRSVLLVGDKGIGKRSIVESFMYKCEHEFPSYQVMTLNYDALVSTSLTQMDFSKKMDDAFFIALNNEASNIVLNINNLGHYLDRDCYNTGGYAFLNDLATNIEAGVRVIATTTTNEFKTIEDDFPYILDYFTIIKVPELTKEQSKEILAENIPYFNDIFNINIPVGTLDIICNNADKYIKDVPFPEKAIRLMDEVSSNIVAKKCDMSKLTTLLSNENELKLKLQEAYENNDYDKCDEIQTKIVAIENKIAKINSKRKPIEITETDILDAVSGILGVNMSRVSSEQAQFLKEMPSEIKKKVIGQDETVDTIVKNICRNQLGLRKSAHSAGNFIFIGSTGVGKTFLAKQLANYLYGSEENMLRFDMSEYQSEIDVSKLLGSAPGYVGYKESGLLVKRLAKYPESVVLFDEIEKAHPKIYDVLLQLLDEGFVTGSDGNKVDATKALIIFTSNIGVRNAKEMASPMGYSNNVESDKKKKKEELIRKALNKRFSPEFLNRLDGICYFNSLDRDALKTILHNEMEEVNENIKTICGKTVELSESVENWLLDKVEKEDNGARPIIRLLQQEIEEEMTTMILNDDDVFKSKDVFTATMDNDKIILK